MAKIKEYKVDDFTKFVVTGRLYNSNKRFKHVYSDWRTANMINLWNGSVWGILKSTGKRVRLKTVYN
jgi:hypothetical protein